MERDRFLVGVLGLGLGQERETGLERAPYRLTASCPQSLAYTPDGDRVDRIGLQ
jgi:hypothetical protein